eukprot:gene15916-7250_t
MALVNADNKKRLAVFGRLLRERSRRRALQQSVIISFLRRRIVLKAYLLILLLLLYDKVVVQPRREARRRQRTCRRLPRNTGWCNNVKDHYSNARFKKTFRVSRETFSFILERVKHDIEKKSLTEKPIPAEIRLAVCLYRLGRGDYLYTISELTGFAVATVCQIVNEVSAAIVNNLWDETNVDGSEIAPLLLGDGAFPFHTWLMKPYSNAYLTPQQRYFNYRLSRARMVTEGAFGQLKGRWRILLRKCESRPENVKVFTFACVVLHNLCIRCQDVAPRQ